MVARPPRHGGVGELPLVLVLVLEVVVGLVGELALAILAPVVALAHRERIVRHRACRVYRSIVGASTPRLLGYKGKGLRLPALWLPGPAGFLAGVTVGVDFLRATCAQRGERGGRRVAVVGERSMISVRTDVSVRRPMVEAAD